MTIDIGQLKLITAFGGVGEMPALPTFDEIEI
jgi:hypothetical protein